MTRISTTTWDRSRLVRGAVLAVTVLSIATASPTFAKPVPVKLVSYFYDVKGAKDCAYDEKRQRLYVTTLKQLVILDTAKRKVIDKIDLLGGVQACDISPDFQYLAVAPSQGQYLYWIKLDDLEISRVRFAAGARESGVYDLCIGADNSILFSMTFAGSGWVQLRRFIPSMTKVETVGRVRMNTILTASPDRKCAAVAEGNISSGPLRLYDFESQTLKKVADLQCFHFEIACSRGAKYFARPHGKGIDLHLGQGTKLGTLEGKPVLCAAFHPKTNRLFVMRHGELSIQEYNVEGQKIANEYPLDKPLRIQADVRDSVIVNVHPVGRDAVIANFRGVRQVTFRTFASGRLKVSESGSHLFAVLPTGVYMFPVKPSAKVDPTKPTRPKIRDIETDPVKIP